MRLISFALTTRQFLDGSKDVTRRLGWKFLRPGDRLLAVEKAMGLAKGQHPLPLGVIEILSNETVPLESIPPADVAREGFGDWTPRQFVAFFCREMKVAPDQAVQRIEFRRITSESPELPACEPAGRSSGISASCG